MLTSVSIDVYLTLVCQVGGAVALADTYRTQPVHQAPAQLTSLHPPGLMG